MKAAHIGMTAVLATCAGHAVAQSNVTVYGSLDAGLEYQKISAGAAGDASSHLGFANGLSKANRLGFRGTEEIGGGTSVFFQIEGGMDLGTGASVPSGVLFNRRSIVGARGPWGEVSIGRDYTPAFWAMAYADYTKSGMYGGAGPTSQIVELGLIRQSNGVTYTTPKFGGFSVKTYWSSGSGTTASGSSIDGMVGVASLYQSGPAAAGIFYEQQKVNGASLTASGTNRYRGVTGQYDFGWLTVNGGYTRYDPIGPKTAASGPMNSIWLGFMVPVGADQISLTLGHIRTSLNAPEDGKTWLYGLNYIHPLSTRTSLYAGIGRSSNNSRAKIALDAGQRGIAPNGLGSDVTAVMVGMRHLF